MSNIYEQMLLNDKAALESKITNLVEEQLNNEYRAKEELDVIAKVIDYSLNITETCCWEVDNPIVSGEITFSSVGDYLDKEEYWSAVEAEDGGVSWDCDIQDCNGSFSWDFCPSVSVEVLGLTEDASDEARTLWEAQSKAEEDRQKLDWKRKRLEQKQRELLELQAELSAAEANA